VARITLAVLKNSIDNLKESMEKGFESINIRQDIANGKRAKHELKINTAELKLEEHEDKFITREELLKSQVAKTSKTKEYVLGAVFGLGVSMFTLIAEKYFGG